MEPKLKLKYRIQRSAPGGRYKTRTGNSNGVLKVKTAIRPRKKKYGPF